MEDLIVINNCDFPFCIYRASQFCEHRVFFIKGYHTILPKRCLEEFHKIHNNLGFFMDVFRTSVGEMCRVGWHTKKFKQ